MQNPDIARLFDGWRTSSDPGRESVRVRAYVTPPAPIPDFPSLIADLVRTGTKDLTDIAASGTTCAEKITAIVTTGELPLRKQLASKLPAGLLDLLRFRPRAKRVKLLYKKLKVKSAARPRRGARQRKIQKLKGFGPKMEEKIRAGSARRRPGSGACSQRSREPGHRGPGVSRGGGGIGKSRWRGATGGGARRSGTWTSS